MSDYTELVKALTCGNDGKLPCHNNECPYWVDQWHGIGLCNVTKKDADAAAAIEALRRELNLAEIAADDNGRQVEKLQAEVKRLKDVIDELREAQTYIDHYGDKWLTSAKDVPTSAYNHGYMDGKNEAEQALEPKRGEWSEENRRPRSSQFVCSVCHRTAYDPQPTRDKAWRKRCRYAYCPNCGAKMNDSNTSNASNALNALDNAQDGPIITPCRGCSDYDGYGGCKSKGGCARAKMEVQE